MNQRQFASVLFAAIGVFIIVSRLPEVPVHLALITQLASAGQNSPDLGGQGLLSVAAFAATIVAIGIGATLLLLRDRLAQRLFPAIAPSLETAGIQTAAFAILGCYFAVHGISRIFWAGGFYNNWTAATQLVLGVALFFGARGLSRFWLLRQPREDHDAAERAI
jgi:hypothetical protein